MTKELFTQLNSINVKDKTEKKNGLTYLSWSWAWSEFMKICPQARYEIKMFDGKPYIYDEKLGYMVFTSITVDADTKDMWLPVMDSANKAMLDHPYKYLVKGKWNNEKKEYDMVEKTCEQATMFDINKTIMRCLTKNISMFGLGLYIYSGEDLPEEEKTLTEEKKETEKNKRWQGLQEDLNIKDLADEFRKLYTQEEQDRILKGLKYTRAEDIGIVDLQKYVNFKKYGKK